MKTDAEYYVGMYIVAIFFYAQGFSDCIGSDDETKESAINYYSKKLECLCNKSVINYFWVIFNMGVV